MGFSPGLRFLLGNQENEGSCLSRSWSPRGELGVGMGAAVGFLGVAVVRYTVWRASFPSGNWNSNGDQLCSIAC